MRIITIDFETAWNSKDYSISKMNLDQYINDSRFHAQIFVFRINRSEVNVINGRHDAYIRTAIRELGLDRPYTITVGHNIRKLDALILERKYGVLFSVLFKTITCDNGTEFSAMANMEQSIFAGQRTTIYYCHPYSSWERGQNENQNALIRRFIPKGTRMENYNEEYIQAVEDWINNLPRLKYQYSTSKMLFSTAISKIL